PPHTPTLFPYTTLFRSLGTLHTPAVLNQQVRRMLSDPKSDALVTNFAGQWLYLRNLKNLQPNSLEFPDFDDNLRQSLQRETELLDRKSTRLNSSHVSIS